MDIDKKVAEEVEAIHTRLRMILKSIEDTPARKAYAKTYPNILTHHDFHDCVKAYWLLMRFTKSMGTHHGHKKSVASDLLIKRIKGLREELMKPMEAYLRAHPTGRWLLQQPFMGAVTASFMMTYINPLKLRSKRALNVFLRIEHTWLKGRRRGKLPTHRVQSARKAYWIMNMWTGRLLQSKTHSWYAIVEARRAYEEAKVPDINRYHRDAKVRRWLLKRMAWRFLVKYRKHLGLKTSARKLMRG
jgi:hypothetical protein